MKYKWFEKDGHIFSEEKKTKKSNDFRFGSLYEQQVLIAANVGPRLARYITELHNREIEQA